MALKAGCRVLGIAVLLLPSAVTDAAESVVGTVSGVSAESIEVKETRGSSRVVKLTNETRYLRWITHRPWQQDTGVDRGLLEAGRCISVDLARGGAAAKVVHISTDESGSIFDPCRDAR